MNAFTSGFSRHFVGLPDQGSDFDRPEPLDLTELLSIDWSSCLEEAVSSYKTLLEFQPDDAPKFFECLESQDIGFDAECQAFCRTMSKIDIAAGVFEDPTIISMQKRKSSSPSFKPLLYFDSIVKLEEWFENIVPDAGYFCKELEPYVQDYGLYLDSQTS